MGLFKEFYLNESKVTDFKKGQNNWVNGKIGKYSFEAKVFDVGSQHGIDGGKVSKLYVTDKNGPIMNYDRGWDMEPKSDAHKKILKDLLKHFA